MTINCMPGGEWDNDYIPSCQEVYCGPVPQIDNGFAVEASNVTYEVNCLYFFFFSLSYFLSFFPAFFYSFLSFIFSFSLSFCLSFCIIAEHFV